MKIKNIVQVAVLAVIGFVLAQAIAMLVDIAGTLSLYVGGGNINKEGKATKYILDELELEKLKECFNFKIRQ